ncbi:MAG: nuclear transport factor 2 family protein [Pseudomonadota bacterium]
MKDVHRYATILGQVDVSAMRRSAHLFHPTAVWWFYNSELPDLSGDHVGFDAICAFFDRLKARTGGTFDVSPQHLRVVGDELVVVETLNRMTLDAVQIEVDVVVVWRFIDGLIAEVWDIPATNTARISKGSVAGPLTMSSDNDRTVAPCGPRLSQA